MTTEQSTIENEAKEPKAYKAKRLSRKGKTFDDYLVEFSKTMETAQDLALTLSQMAIERFAEHGDLSYCQRFHDAMPKNFARRVAFLRWLDAHSPVLMEGGVLKKDKSDNATAFNLEAAMTKPFWEFAPDPEQIVFTTNDIVTQLKQVIRRNGNDNHKAATEEDAAALALAEKAVADFEKTVIKTNVA